MVGVALHLNEGNGRHTERAIRVDDAVVGVLPALIGQSLFRLRAVVYEAADAVPRIAVRPAEGALNAALEPPEGVEVAGPADVGAEQHEEPEGRVYRAIVGILRDLMQVRHLANTELVQNLARLLVLETIIFRSLIACEH